MYVVLNSCESANEKITFNTNYSIIPKPQQLSITEGFYSKSCGVSGSFEPVSIRSKGIRFDKTSLSSDFYV